MVESNYFQVALSSSLVVFGFNGKQLLIVTEKRKKSPFKGAPMLPSKMVLPEESLESATNSLLKSIFGETTENHTEQLKAFANPYRNSDGRVVNIAQYAVLRYAATQLKMNSNYQWCDLEDLPSLVFDHDEILTFAKERLKRRVKRRPIGFHFLPKEFTFKEIHTLYELALRKKLDKRNFRKKLFSSDLLVDTNKSVTVEENNKPSNLYMFNTKEYEKLTLKGYDFSFK
jgi:8-oxo-dGTP diphosphatase